LTLYTPLHPPDPHPFPTRRSSDLSVAAPAPQLEAVLLSPREPRDVGAVEEGDRHAGSAPERDHRPRVAEQPCPESERNSSRHRRSEERRVGKEWQARAGREP